MGIRKLEIKKIGEGSEGFCECECECCRCERGCISECEKGISEVENGKVRCCWLVLRCDVCEIW